MNCILCGGGNLRELLPFYYSCGECRLAFLDPARRLSAAAEGERYRAHENHPNDAGYRAFLRPMVDLIGKSGARRILDFGCGAGAPLKAWLEPAGYKVSLFDPFFYPDRSALREKYDFVAATEVIEHLRDPAEEFGRLRELVTPGGMLGLMTDLLDEKTDFANWYYRRDPTHVAFYTRETFGWIQRNYAFTKLLIHSPRLIEFTA